MPKIVRNDFVERTPAEKQLIRHYQRAARQLVGVIATMPANPHRITRQKALANILSILRDLDGTTNTWVEKNIPKFYRKGVNDTSAEYKFFKEKGFKIFPHSGVNSKALSILVDETSLAFANTIVSVKKNMEKSITQIQKQSMQDKIIRDTITGEARTKTEIVAELRSKGIEVFRAYGPKRTRIFRLEDYADILVRSQTMRAYNGGIMSRSFDAGRRFMKVSKVRPDVDGQDICNEHEGKIIDLMDTSQVLPPFHPRCRHILIPVSFSEIKRKRPDLYEKALAYFRKTAKS